MNAELHTAVDNSVKTGKTVTVAVDSESDMQKAFEELTSDGAVAKFDFRDYSGTLREVWGTTVDGSEWRVNLTQSERLGAARFHE